MGSVDPHIIVSVVRYKTQDGNLTNSRSNISTSRLHGHQCSEYYAGLNEVLDMTYSVNPNAVSLHSDDFLLLVNNNVPKKYRYIVIVSNMLDFPSKGIVSANQVHFYNDKPRKLDGNQILITTYGI